MKIAINDTAVSFWMLKPGDAFMPSKEKELYMRVQDRILLDAPNAVRLSDGGLIRYDSDEPVVLWKVKVVEDEEK